MGLLWASFALLLLASGARAVSEVADTADSFPGWLGVSSEVRPRTLPKRRLDMRKVKQLSRENPRAYLYEGFLSEAECDHIRAKAEPHLYRSAVTNNNDGHSELSEVRTSSGTFISKSEDAVIRMIEERISDWTFLPTENQEPLQVLKYTKGQKYEPHVDYFHDPINTRFGGHRYATVLMYLSNVTKGGETVFPSHKDYRPKDNTWSDCAKGVLAVKPRKGDALLFFSMHVDGSPDVTSTHYACPVVEGVKWSAPMWIHAADLRKPYKFPDEEPDRPGCADTNRLCRTWAQEGECKKNAGYMIEACKKSCHACYKK